MSRPTGVRHIADTAALYGVVAHLERLRLEVARSQPAVRYLRARYLSRAFGQSPREPLKGGTCAGLLGIQS